MGWLVFLISRGLCSRVKGRLHSACVRIVMLYKSERDLGKKVRGQLKEKMWSD